MKENKEDISIQRIEIESYCKCLVECKNILRTEYFFSVHFSQTSAAYEEKEIQEWKDKLKKISVWKKNQYLRNNSFSFI